MTTIIEGAHQGQGIKVGIVVSRFNQFVTQVLLERCLEILQASGVSESDITVAWVPGAFELPLMAEKLVNKSVHGVICLGAVIRGETSHFDYVCQESARGISQVMLQTGKPVLFGVLTTETMEQALERASKDGENKGEDMAYALLEMVDGIKQIG